MQIITYEPGKLYNLSMSQIQPDPEQPRKYFDAQALADLKASIDKHGVLQPVLVRPGTDGRFLLVSGERRYQANRLAGRETIPAIITAGEPAEIALVENLLRENLTAIEEAEAIDRLRSQHQYQLSDLATGLGKSVSTISEILSLTRLPAAVKDDCRNDPRTSRSILTEIAKKRTPEQMTALYTKYKESGLTRGEIRKKKRPPKPADAPVNLTFISVCGKRIDALDPAKLIATGQREAAQTELQKLQNFIVNTLAKLNG